MKRILSLTCILLACVSVAFAQKDAKAKEVLDKASKAFAQSGDLSASFSMQVKDAASNSSESFEGKIDLKGSMFHVQVPDYEMWFDGKTQWLLQYEWEEVTVSEPSKEEVQALNPSVLFELYKKGCDYKSLGERTNIRMQKVHEVELIPPGKDNDITKITLQISLSDSLPAMIHLVYKNGVENIIYIGKYETKQELPDSLFAFDPAKYPNAEIIDLR